MPQGRSALCAISVNVNANDYSAARLVDEILPRLHDMRDLLIPAEMRMAPAAQPSKHSRKNGQNCKTPCRKVQAMSDYIRQYNDEGYAIIRNVFSQREMAEISAAAEEVVPERLQQLGKVGATKNLYFEVIDDKGIGTTTRQVQWVAWCNERLAALRIDRRFLEILEPMIGNNLEALGNQLHWRPGAKMVGFRYHQDARFRTPPEAFRALNDLLRADRPRHRPPHSR